MRKKKRFLSEENVSAALCCLGYMALAMLFFLHWLFIGY